MNRRQPFQASGYAFNAFTQNVGRRGSIRSIQRGTVTLTAAASNTATISAVSTSDSRIKDLRNSYSNASDANSANWYVLVALTNSTTVTISRSGSGNNTTGSYEVIEHHPGVINLSQRGTIALSAAQTSNTATITAVVLTQSELDHLGTSNGDTNGFGAINQIQEVLTNSTTITATRTQAQTSTVGYQVTQWT